MHEVQFETCNKYVVYSEPSISLHLVLNRGVKKANGVSQTLNIRNSIRIRLFNIHISSSNIESMFCILREVLYNLNTCLTKLLLSYDTTVNGNSSVVDAMEQERAGNLGKIAKREREQPSVFFGDGIDALVCDLTTQTVNTSHVVWEEG